MWCCEQAFQARLSRCVMSPTCLDGIRALIYLWLGICYSLWHCNCLYFIGCLKQFNMVGSRRGCIPAETQQVRAGWLEAPQYSLLMDSWLPRAMEGLPKKWSLRFFSSSSGASPSGNRDTPPPPASAILRSHHSRCPHLLRELANQLWNEPPAGSNRIRV